MLSSDYLFTLTDEISKMYEELNTSVINDIARRIAKMDYTSESTIFQAERAAETGALYDDIVKKISMQTGKSQEELKRLFKEAGFKNYENNLRKHSMSYKNIQLSERAKNILIAGINKTGGVLHNMTMTTASEAQNDFIHITDLAYNQIVNGVMDYNTAIRYAVKDLANKGLKVIDYKTGYKQRIDSAVRTCVLTGVNQTTGPMTELQRQEVGADGYETTAHSGARPEHALWQGKQFYADKSVKGYEDFTTATGYGTVTGLKGANCRHDFFWVFLGEDEPSYTKSEIRALNNKSVKYNGKEMTIAEAETTMRYIERKTREWKRQANALSAAGLDNSFEKMKAKEWSNKYKDFANKTGIPKRNERLVAYDKYTKNVNNNLQNLKQNSRIIQKTLTVSECKQLMEKQNIYFWEKDLSQIDNKLLSENTQRLNELINKYPKMKQFISSRNVKFNALNLDNSTMACCSTDLNMQNIEISLNKKKYKEYDKLIKTETNEFKIKNSMQSAEKYRSVYSLTHEFGHFIENSFIDEYNKTHIIEFSNMKTRALNAKNIVQSKKIIKQWNMNICDNIAQEIYDIARQNNPKINVNNLLSEYGKTNSFEFFAECFANLECGMPNELGKAMGDFLKRRGV